MNLPPQLGCVVMSAFFVVIGARGLLRRRSQVFSARWIFGLVAVGTLPPAVEAWRLPHSDSSELPTSLIAVPVLLLIALVVTLAFMWAMTRGYTLLGVTDESFRQALHHALGSLGLPFEERLSLIRLSSLDADLKVAVDPAVGMAMITLEPVRRRSELKAIAAKMREFFAEHDVPTNRITPVLYFVLGLILLGLSAVTLALNWEIRWRHDDAQLVGTVAPNFALTTLAGDRVERVERVGKETPRREGRLLAVAIRLWKHRRSLLHLYDASGKLLYHELLEGMYGGLTVVEQTEGRPAVLLGGRDQVFRYELP